jgi:hypothetical protein
VATLFQRPSGSWKAVIRKTGWPMATKTFRIKRDAEDWARRTEDEIVRGAYIERATADRTTIKDALARYLAEVTPTKRPKSQICERGFAKPLLQHPSLRCVLQSFTRHEQITNLIVPSSA